MSSIQTVTFNKKKIKLKVNLFDIEDGEIDLNKILTIDYRNLVKECLTFPLVMHKLGVLLADAENQVKEADISYRSWYAKARKDVRGRFSDKEDPLYKGRYNADQVDDQVRSESKYRVKKSILAKKEKQRDVVNSLFWSAKGKADTLNKLSLGLQNHVASGEIDIDELFGTFNGVELNVRKSLMSDD